jgi:hypothetical protein
VPAVLCECSFYTDPAEEQRLRDAGYNLREAYGIYVGLCRWAYAGRPTQSLPVVEPGTGRRIEISTVLDEGLPAWWGVDRSRILRSSVHVAVDGKTVPIQFDEVARTVTATLPTTALSPSHRRRHKS